QFRDTPDYEPARPPGTGSPPGRDSIAPLSPDHPKKRGKAAPATHGRERSGSNAAELRRDRPKPPAHRLAQRKSAPAQEARRRPRPVLPGGRARPKRHETQSASAGFRDRKGASIAIIRLPQLADRHSAQ